MQNMLIIPGIVTAKCNNSHDFKSNASYEKHQTAWYLHT